MSVDRRLAVAFLEAHPLDGSRVLERLDVGEAVAALAEAPASVAAGVLSRMALTVATECLDRLPPERAAALVMELPLDEAAVLLRRLPEAPAAVLLAALPREVRVPLETVLRHPEHTAGGIMDPRVFAIEEDATVEEALARVQRAPRHVLYYLYVVDRAWRLVGVLNLRELMLSVPSATLRSVMRQAAARLATGDSLRAVVVHPGWRALHALPVVDAEGRFAGAIRHEIVRRIAERLEQTAPAGSGLGTLLGLAELCWVGMTGVLAGLTGAPPADASPPGERRAR
jgi:Mg/Co/Ni transporter MgtE